MPEQPRFIVDVMLGSLSKWLRILGFDTLYRRDLDDNELVRIAKQEQRILLTKDTHLATSKRAGTCLFIGAHDTREQLKEVLSAVVPHQQPAAVTEKSSLKSDDFMEHAQWKLPPRCTRCNGPLSPVSKESVANDVPEHVLINCDSFLQCGECSKIYWEGTHKRMIDKRVQEIVKEIMRAWDN